MPKLVSTALVRLPTRPHVLYRFFDRTDALLYIGITMDFEKRMAAHRKTKRWWPAVSSITLEHLDNRYDALAAETDAIKTEKPLYNEAQNEMVQAPMLYSEDHARDLAAEILGLLDGDLREVLLHDNRYDWEDRELSERDQYIAAAQGALGAMSWEGLRLAQSLLTVFQYLPEGQWERCHKVAERTLSEQGQTGTRAAWVLATAEALHTELATEYLGTLPEAERDEWLLGAQNANPNFDVAVWARVAADRAKDWKGRGGCLAADMCVGSGIHGARCPERAEFRIWQANCSCCERETGGHSVCRSHHEAVLAGNVTRSDDAAVVVVRAAPLSGWPY
jgi:predicted GIY-YIG superfamily endonuclease